MLDRKLDRKSIDNRCGDRRDSHRPAANLVVSISARHCHLTDEHVEILFGKGRKLTTEKPLYQDGFYAAEETVMVVGPTDGGCCPTCACSGPTRPHSQVELAFTDAISLGIEIPVRPAATSTALRAACWSARRRGRAARRRDPRRAARPHEPRATPTYYGVKNGDRMNLRIESHAARSCSKTCSCGPTRPASSKSTSTPTKATPADLDHATKVELLKQA